MALCAISGVVPQEPVVSVKSGHVFEKRLVEKHIEMTGKCPITNEDLALTSLIPLQVPKVVKPRPPTATSIPGIIQIMQNEWDSLMLETYSLKKHLEDVRQELAHALYQHDAACRVIARLIKERDAARSALGDTQANMSAAAQQKPAANGSAAPMETAADEPGLNKTISAKMAAAAQELQANRKKVVKAAAARVPPKEKIAQFSQWNSFTPHSASKPGLTAVDVRASSSDLILTGGVDTNAVVFNQKTGKIVDTLKGHKKAVTSVKFHPDPNSGIAFTTSQDNTAIVWKQQDGKSHAAHVLQEHKAAVTSVTVHPTGAYFVTGSLDSTWNFYDTATGSLRQSVSDEKVSAGFTRVTFHPDGLIMGTGTGAGDASVRIFDVRAQKNVATFKGHGGAVADISFSENGYYLASADTKGVVKLWDLRKLENLHTLDASSALKGVKVVNALDFDASGSYLAVASDKDIRVFNTTKTWDLLHTVSDHTADVTGVRWGVDAGSLISCSMDRSLRVFGPTA